MTPTWEFQDDEEKARSALTFSTQNRDANGYSAAQSSALKALKKMEEPLTEDEIKALASKASKMQNDYDPMSPQNVNARRKADRKSTGKRSRRLLHAVTIVSGHLV